MGDLVSLESTKNDQGQSEKVVGSRKVPS